jgi:hypothetical protein
VPNQQQQPLTQLTLTVAAGGNGDFALYQDAGEGNGYRAGQSTSTPISWHDANRTLTVGPAVGGYSGAATACAYTLRLTDTAAPAAVSVDGRRLPGTAWSYDAGTRTVTVTTASLSVRTPHRVSLLGS